MCVCGFGGRGLRTAELMDKGCNCGGQSNISGCEVSKEIDQVKTAQLRRGRDEGPWPKGKV